MKNLTLMRKLTVLGGAFVVLAILVFVTLVSSVSSVSRSSEAIAEQAIPVVNAGHELKMAVVQVQQWLSDISATRGLDGLDDGFAEAAKNAEQFHQLITRLGQLDPEHRSEYEALVPTFEDYYTVGQKMAHAYVEQGPAGGNRMMGEFDGVAAAINEQVESLLQAISQRSGAALNKQATDLRSMQRMVFGSLLVMVVLVLAMFIVVYRAIRLLPLVVEELRTIAAGDLTNNSRIASNNDEIGWLCDGLGEMKTQLKNLLLQISSTAQQLATAAEEMTAVAAQSRTSVERQQVEINQLATAMSEMSATANEVAQNANLTSGSARDANDEAHGGSTVVQASINGMRGLATDVNHAAEVIGQLEQHSEDIGSIMLVIRGIADQTNLLALNAAIEAARAGEQGRGFAVVADEVRNLASRTQESTKEIESMIEQLQQGAANAVSVMQLGRDKADASVEEIVKAGERLKSITAAVASITDMNLQIATAAEEQSQVADEMARSINDISQVAEETSIGASHTADASQQLAVLSYELQDLIKHFKV